MHKVCFQSFINKVSSSEWFLDNIPDYFSKTLVDGKERPSWVVYWEYLDNEIKKSEHKPKEIKINRNVFWAFFDDLIRHNYRNEIKVSLV
jgi:hypothetical protein